MDFARHVVTFEVPGSPSGFGEPGGGPTEWRNRCRDAARAALEGASIPVGCPVKLVVQFAVLRRARAHDIDNLLKPLIDALGAAGLFPSRAAGGRPSEWNTHDSWVYAIDAQKELVDERAYTRVEILAGETVAPSH